MKRQKRLLTLGDVVRTVARFARNDHEVSFIVADLLQRGVVKARGRHKQFKVTA